MRKIAWFLVLLSFLPVISVAQEPPKAEIFAGYSRFLTPNGFFENKFSGTLTSIVDRANLNGWNASIVGNANRWLGVEGDFGGYYGRVTSQSTTFHFTGGGVTSSTTSDTAKVRFHSFLFGPRISYRMYKKDRSNEIVVLFAHALAGGIRETIVGAQIPPGSSETSFGMALGGGLDVKASRHVAIRVFQADYVRSRFGFRVENNLRLSFGAVFQFGGG